MGLHTQHHTNSPQRQPGALTKSRALEPGRPGFAPGCSSCHTGILTSCVTTDSLKLSLPKFPCLQNAIYNTYFRGMLRE